MSEQKETLLPEDKAVLEAAKNKKVLALALAEKAIAQNESADLAYQNIVLQLAFKYKLSYKDAITENGEIIREKVESNESKDV